MTPEQIKKATEYNQQELENGDITPAMIVRLITHWQETHDLDDDGWAGPMTQKSLRNSIEAEWQPAPTWNLAGESQFVDGEWLPWDGPEDSQPKSGQQTKYFGNPETRKGSDVMSSKWYRANVIECHQSLGNRLPGIPAKWYIKVHRMVEPYLREALRRVSLSSPDYPIERMGSYKFRHMGGDPNRSLSMHSFGVAFDVNPDDNGGQRYDKGKAPKAYDSRYMKRWPKGVPAEFVQAFTSCGFAWGSDWDEDGKTEDHSFLDPMHFEWVARDGNKKEV